MKVSHASLEYGNYLNTLCMSLIRDNTKRCI